MTKQPLGDRQVLVELENGQFKQTLARYVRLSWGGCDLRVRNAWALSSNGEDYEPIITTTQDKDGNTFLIPINQGDPR